MHRRTPILILILLVWLLAACDPMAISTPTPSPQPPTPTAEAALSTPTTGAAAPTATGQGDSIGPEVQAEITEIESETANLRGLQPKEDVPEKFVPQAQLKANLAGEIDQE